MHDVSEKKKCENRIDIPIICLGLFLITMFCNPDPYLGIADYYIFILAYMLMTFMYRTHIRINADTLMCVFMFGYLTLSYVLPLFSGKLSSGYALSYLLYVIMLFLVTGITYSKEDVEFFINSYIFSGIIICSLIIIFRYDYYGSGGERITIKMLKNPAIDPNHLGAYLCVPFILSFGKLLNKIKWTNGVAAFLLVVGMLSTASRGAMLAAFVGVFITMFLYLKNSKKRKKIEVKKILIIVVVILTFCVVAWKYVPVNSLIRLFDFSTYIDGSNSKRIANWIAGLEAFYQKPLLGYGPRGEMKIIQEATGESRIAHNTYIAALLQFGLLGVLLFGLYICYLFQKNKNNCTVIGCLVATLTVSIFVSGQVAVFVWVPLALANIVGNYERDFSMSIL